MLPVRGWAMFSGRFECDLVELLVDVSGAQSAVL
jgi:hypothetical protein